MQSQNKFFHLMLVLNMFKVDLLHHVVNAKDGA